MPNKQTNKQRSTDNRELSSLDHARARKRTQSPTPGGRGSVSPRLASGAHRWSAPPRAALTLGVVRSIVCLFVCLFVTGEGTVRAQATAASHSATAAQPSDLPPRASPSSTTNTITSSETTVSGDCVSRARPHCDLRVRLAAHEFTTRACTRMLARAQI